MNNDLKIRLEQHAMWLFNNEKGKRFEISYGENLSNANLRYANLSYANLRNADLSNTNLSYAIGFKFNPLQIVNTKFFVTVFDDHVIWGCKKMTFDELRSFELKDCTSEWEPNEFKLNKKIITEMIRYYRKESK